MGRQWWYWSGVLVARLGDEMAGQALLLLGLALLHDTERSAQLLAALTVSAVLGGPWLGAVLDRTPRPGVVLAAVLGGYALGLLLVGGLLQRAPFAVVLLIALLAGLLMPAISGGWSAQLPLMVTPAQQPRASAFDAATFNLTGLIGPATAGLVAAFLSPWWSYAAVVVLTLLALPCALLLPRRAITVTDIAPPGLLRQSWQGFRALWSHPRLWRVTVLSTFSFIGVGNLAVLAALLGRDLWGEAGYGGVLLSLVAVGAMAGTLLYARWPSLLPPDLVALLTAVIFAAALWLLVLWPAPWLTIVAMLLIGLADGPQLAAVLAVRHQDAPPAYRTQVFMTGASLKLTAGACGAALAGWLATFSRNAVIHGAALSQVVAIVAFVALWLWGRRTTRPDSSQPIMTPTAHNEGQR